MSSNNLKEQGACWYAQLRLMGQLLLLWFVVAVGHAFWVSSEILEIERDSIRYWLAEQGCLIFSALEILYYLWRARQLDHRGAVNH